MEDGRNSRRRSYRKVVRERPGLVSLRAVPQVEPEAVAVNGNGHEAIGPTVELVPVNGRHANGNGHHDEAPEPHQSLFSWAEFMAEEPVKPRGRKTQAPSLSLFEWAVEQERVEELIGAGR